MKILLLKIWENDCVYFLLFSLFFAIYFAQYLKTSLSDIRYLLLGCAHLICFIELHIRQKDISDITDETMVHDIWDWVAIVWPKYNSVSVNLFIFFRKWDIFHFYHDIFWTFLEYHLYILYSLLSIHTHGALILNKTYSELLQWMIIWLIVPHYRGPARSNVNSNTWQAHVVFFRRFLLVSSV